MRPIPACYASEDFPMVTEQGFKPETSCTEILDQNESMDL